MWELPIYVAAACSITARVVTFAMLRRAAAQDLIWEKDDGGGLGMAGGFGSGGAQWGLPKDLTSDLWTSRAQLSRMVSGASLRVLSRSLSASASEAAASEAGAAATDAEPDARLSGWRAWVAQGKEISRLVARWLDGSLRLRDGSLRERTSRSQHLHRFVQMSADLTTLRWSWSDYILLHEIVAIEADEPGLALRLHHGPRDALKVLELTFEERGTWATWHEGMKALHAVLLEGAGEPRKLEWLLQIFRLADTANLGSVSEVQLRELMLYLNYEERESAGVGTPPPRQSISSRLGALLAPVKRAQSTYNFREFQQMVQERAVMLSIEALLAPLHAAIPADPTRAGAAASGRKSSRKSSATRSRRRSRRRSSLSDRLQSSLRAFARSSSELVRVNLGRTPSEDDLPPPAHSWPQDASSSAALDADAAAPPAAAPAYAGASNSASNSVASLLSSSTSSQDTPSRDAASSRGVSNEGSTSPTSPQHSGPGARYLAALSRRRAAKATEALGGGRRTISLRMGSLSAGPKRAKTERRDRAGLATQGTLHEDSAEERRSSSGRRSSAGRSRKGNSRCFSRSTSQPDQGGAPRAAAPPPPKVDKVEVMQGLWRHPRLQGPGGEAMSEAMVRTFREAIARHAVDTEGEAQWLSKRVLQRLLLSEENELFDPARRRVDLSDGKMDHPLTDYFVASSHNSYLVGDQFRSNSDCRMYEQQLLMGCRCLEIDCWDGADGEPTVYHGMTFTSKIKFKDVIISIANFAFVASAYPVVLSLEMHCSLPQQEKIAHYLVEHLREKLHRPSGRDLPLRPCFGMNLNTLPSPRQLRYKVLVKGRTLDDDASSGTLLEDDQVFSDDEKPYDEKPYGADEAFSALETQPEDEASRRGSVLAQQLSPRGAAALQGGAGRAGGLSPFGRLEEGIEEEVSEARRSREASRLGASCAAELSSRPCGELRDESCAAESSVRRSAARSTISTSIGSRLTISKP